MKTESTTATSNVEDKNSASCAPAQVSVSSGVAAHCLTPALVDSWRCRRRGGPHGRAGKLALVSRPDMTRKIYLILSRGDIQNIEHQVEQL